MFVPETVIAVVVEGFFVAEVDGLICPPT